MLRITLATALASVAAAQTPTNVFEIYSGCTNYTSRDALDVNAGEILMKIPGSHFSSVGMDDAGTGTRSDRPAAHHPTVLTPAGVGTGTLFPAAPEVGALANRAVDFQAFSVAPNFRLPGRLTNRARVTYLR